MVGSIRLAEHAWAGSALSDVLVLDAHAHIGQCGQYSVPWPSTDEKVDDMDRFGIDRASIFAFAGVSSDFVWGNDLAIEAVRAYPDRFIGYATLNANYPEELIPELDRTFALGLRGIKLITAYQGVPVETERLFPVYEWANARGTILLSHHWGAPEFLDRLARRYPNVSFHIGHLNPEYARAVRSNRNVYTTTTFVPWPGAIAQAVETFGADNVLFGSDSPDLDVSLNLGPLLTARIKDQDKLQILGGNMQAILQARGLA